MSDHQIIVPDAHRSTWISDLCHVCQRALVRTMLPGSPAARACEQCLEIDSALGAPFLARLLTPLDPGRADGRAVLHDRLWGAAAASVHTRLRAHHVREIRRLADQARAVGLEGLHVRCPGGPPWASVVSWDAWTRQFPSSVAARLAGYQRYAAAVHPWIDSVEPRVSDLGWLAETVGG